MSHDVHTGGCCRMCLCHASVFCSTSTLQIDVFGHPHVCRDAFAPARSTPPPPTLAHLLLVIAFCSRCASCCLLFVFRGCISVLLPTRISRPCPVRSAYPPQCAVCRVLSGGLSWCCLVFQPGCLRFAHCLCSPHSVVFLADSSRVCGRCCCFPFSGACHMSHVSYCRLLPYSVC